MITGAPRKQLLSLEMCGSESHEAWKGFLDDLVARGLTSPVLCIIDGNPGLRRAVELTWPKAAVQRCAVHKLRNLEPKAPKHAREEIWTGMRKGELLGLLKSDVVLADRSITIQRSYDSDTTKGGRADVIPIAEPLVPYLEAAIATSPSKYVFPAADGSMRSDETDLQQILRSALGRAGIVLGYDFVCRRRGCGHREQHKGLSERRCPKCSMRLWPKALPDRFVFMICVEQPRRCSRAQALHSLSRSVSCGTRTRGLPQTFPRASISATCGMGSTRSASKSTA